MEIEFHRFEKSSFDIHFRELEKKSEQIVCSFKTDRFGTVQMIAKNTVQSTDPPVENVELSITSGVREPDVNMFTDEEKEYIKTYMTAVLLVVFYPDELAN